MIYRKTNLTDVAEINLLWQNVFGDTEEFVCNFIAHFGIDNCYVCEMSEKIVAMAFALPTTLFHCSIFNLKYMYACATHPNYRKQGIMKKLLDTIYEEACKEEVAGIFLHAADENLSNYYRKLGFQDFFYQNCTTFNRTSAGSVSYKEREKGAKNTITFLTPEEYYHKRLQKLEKYCFINWNEDFFKFLHQTGTQFCAYENDIFAFRPEDKRLIVEEWLSVNLDAQIANSLFEYFTDFKSIEICTIGNESCFGQIKWCKFVDKNLLNGYFAFALE